MNNKRYLTVISKKLHDILEANGFKAVSTEPNKNNPVYFVWKYEYSEDILKIREEYMLNAQKQLN